MAAEEKRYETTRYDWRKRLMETVSRRHANVKTSVEERTAGVLAFLADVGRPIPLRRFESPSDWAATRPLTPLLLSRNYRRPVE